MATSALAVELSAFLAADGSGAAVTLFAKRSASGMQRLWGRSSHLGVPTLAALLLTDFLGADQANLFSRCDDERGEVAVTGREAPAVRRSTVARHQREVTSLTRRMRGASRTQLRRTSPTAWKFLLEHDREWLEKEAPEPRKPHVRNRWKSTDVRLEKRARRALATLLAEPGIPRRITFARLAETLGHRTALFRRDARLPRTIAAITAAVEGPDDIVRRRVSWALSGTAGSGLRS